MIRNFRELLMSVRSLGSWRHSAICPLKCHQGHLEEMQELSWYSQGGKREKGPGNLAQRPFLPHRKAYRWYQQGTDLLCKFLLLSTSLDNSSWDKNMQVDLAPYKIWLLLGSGGCWKLEEGLMRVSAGLIGLIWFLRCPAPVMAVPSLTPAVWQS